MIVSIPLSKSLSKNLEITKLYQYIFKNLKIHQHLQIIISLFMFLYFKIVFTLSFSTLLKIYFSMNLIKKNTR